MTARHDHRQRQDSNFESCGFERGLFNPGQAAWFLKRNTEEIQEQESKENFLLIFNFNFFLQNKKLYIMYMKIGSYLRGPLFHYLEDFCILHAYCL